MPTPQPRHLTPALLGFLIAAAMPAAGQNLLQNGRFATNLSGWGVSAAASHNPADSSGWPQSGSLQLANAQASAGAAVFADQCVSPFPVGQQTVRARVFVPAGQSRTGKVYMYVQGNGAPNCFAPGLGSVIVATIAPAPGSWVTLEGTYTPPAGAASGFVVIGVQKNEAGGEFKALVDDVYFGPPCKQTITNLCIGGQRFGVTAKWTTAQGVGDGRPIPLTIDTGYFWFFSAGNVEAVVKAVNGCGLNSRYWVFAGGLTDVKVDLTVTDYETNTARTYSNSQGKPFEPIQDTGAFATCP